MGAEHECYAVTHPGLEALTAAELTAMPLRIVQ